MHNVCVGQLAMHNQAPDHIHTIIPITSAALDMGDTIAQVCESVNQVDACN